MRSIHKKCSFNLLKVDIQENAFVTKSVKFTKSVHSQKLFTNSCKSAKNDVTRLFRVDSLHFLHIGCVPVSAFVQSLAQKTCL